MIRILPHPTTHVWRSAASTYVYLDHKRVEERFRMAQLPVEDTAKEMRTTIVNHYQSVPMEPHRLTLSIDEKVLVDTDAVLVCDKENPLHAAVALTMKEELKILQQEREVATWRRLVERENEARNRAQRFAESIVASKLELIGDDTADGAGKIEVLRNINLMHDGTETKHSVVIRESVAKFWIKAFETVQTKGGMKGPIAIVGNEGIGKSFSIAYGVKKILEMQKPVTVLTRTLNEIDFYYQYLPSEDGSVRCRVFPESTFASALPTMQDPEAYLIVDPGQTRTTCDFSSEISAN